MKPVALISGGAGDLAQAIRMELEAQGWQVHAPRHAQMDVTDKSQVQSVIGGLKRLDLLIHNAGFLRDAPMLRMTEEDFDAACAQRKAPRLMVRQRQGHIVMIGSFSALSGPFGQANYAAAKAGIIGLTQSLAAEYGPRSIRANCVLPGILETKMTRNLLDDAVQYQRILSAHTLGRLNTVQDTARFIAFLHGMGNVSGQVFQLDSRVSRWS